MSQQDSRNDDGLPVDSRTRAIIDGLPPDEREQLQALMNRATARHRQMLEEALTDAMGLVPKPFRKHIEKMFRR